MSWLFNMFGRRSKPSYVEEAVVDGESVQIELDGSGFSSGGSTYFSFNLTGEKITDDTIEIRGETFSIVEIDGVTYVKTTGDL